MRTTTTTPIAAARALAGPSLVRLGNAGVR